jgi:recombination protein RecR
MNSIDRLAEMFKSFPGIGPRQARRFVYFLLSRHSGFSEDLIRAIENLKAEILQCAECQRYFAKMSSNSPLCSICMNENRDPSLLMLVSRDVDMEAIEKSGSYTGRYFVLGGVVPILDKEPEKRIRIRELERKLKNNQDIKEIILAMNANQEGEHTAEYIKAAFKDVPVSFSVLGRGLSTGAELEYADPETLKNALLHRTK